MNRALESIIQSVLYEGYIFDPHHAAPHKEVEFAFGRVYPKTYADTQHGAEPYRSQAECLLEANEEDAEIEITLGFVQPMERQIGRLEAQESGLPENGEIEFHLVPLLEAGGEAYETGTECVERRISEKLTLSSGQRIKPFEFPAQNEQKPIVDSTGQTVGVIVRRSELLNGVLEVNIERLGEKVYKISATTVNYSSIPTKELSAADAVLRRCFASTHFAFEARNAGFVSLLEPPEEYADLCASCTNIGVWPVLTDDDSPREPHGMLASPIILCDNPKAAPPMAEGFFDSAERGESPNWRVVTMAEEEWRDLAGEDFSCGMIERTEMVEVEGGTRCRRVLQPAGALGGPSLHDLFFHPPRPVPTVHVNGIELKAGDRVSIRPKRLETMDLILTEKVGVIEALEEDGEGKVHVAIILEEDSGGRPGFLPEVGHRFFYSLEDIKPIGSEPANGQCPNFRSSERDCVPRSGISRRN